MTTQPIISHLPAEGIPPAELMTEIRNMQDRDVAWTEGKAWSLVYSAGDEHDRLLKEVYESYFFANYLNPFAFDSLRRMEKEVVRMTADMLNGDENVVGTMSSGGTESILLALYTYREWARKHHPHIKHPEVVAPQTIHPAHDKAANLFGLHIRKAPVNQDQMAETAGMERMINKNTILMVASAPSYPNGILDPIVEIGELAQRHHLPFHVDACIGGFMLPWVEKLGAPLPPWDFRVPGVTSISADVHKLGFGAKGASIILYRNLSFLKHQFIITTDFPGGIYISPTLLGTRPGGPIAAAWAAMKHLGAKGYLEIARGLMGGRNRLMAALEVIPEIHVIGDPCMNIVSYTTHHNKPDIFAVADELESKGWLVDRQQFPDCIHLTVLPTNVPVIDAYVSDVKSSIEYAKAHPKAPGEGNAALYGMMSRIPFRSIVEKNVRHIFEAMYGETTEELEEKPASDVIVEASGWMGMISRFLAWWKRIFSKH
jgi:sphinganine-1-phosphate aldolase